MKYQTKKNGQGLALFIIILISAITIISPIGCDALIQKSKLQCADEKCESLYGYGHTMVKYNAPEEGILSFMKDAKVEIYGKTEDSQYLFVKINNKQGYAPARHIQEDKIENPKLVFTLNSETRPHSNLTLEPVVPSELSSSSVETPILSSAPNNPINEQPSAEFVYTSKATVIEGTTIYEDVLATPSPTYPAEAVSKTATIEANFQPITSTAEIDDKELNVSKNDIINNMEENNIKTPELKKNENNDTKTEPETLNVSELSPNSENVAQETKVEDSVAEKEPISTTEHLSETKNESKSSVVLEQNNTLNLDDNKLVEDIKDKSDNFSTQDENIQSVNLVEPKENKINESINLSNDSSNQISNEESKLENEIVQNDLSLGNIVDRNEPVSSSPTSVPDASSNLSQTSNEAVAETNDHKNLTDDVNFEIKPLADGSEPTQNTSTLDMHIQTESKTDVNLTENEILNANNTNTEDGMESVKIAENIQTDSNSIESNPQLNKIPPSRFLPRGMRPRHSKTNDPEPKLQSLQDHNPTPKIDETIIPTTPIPNVVPTSDSNFEPVKSSHLHAEAKIIPVESKEQYHWNNQQLETNEPINNDDSIMHENLGQSSTTAPEVPSSDFAAEQERYNNANINASRRKLLTERMAIVGVIMEIIPDEVELFFESANISLHVIVFSSIIAFFWGFTKVVVSFVNSSRKERELRDINCQVQRKIFYFEAEKDKLREEAKTAIDKLIAHESELRLSEKRKSKLDIEFEQLRNENQILRNENVILRSKADETPQITSKLDSTLNDFEKAKLENRKLEIKIEELEDKIANYEDSIDVQEKSLEANMEKIKSLSNLNKELTKDNNVLQENLNDAENKYSIVQSENQHLKTMQNDLSDELRNLKDELLSQKEKSNQLNTELQSNKSSLNQTTEKLIQLTNELESKSTELLSMQTLLNKLNKLNMDKQEHQLRRQSSAEMNGSLQESSVNGDLLSSTDLNCHSTSLEEENESEEDLQNIVKLQLQLTNVELEKNNLNSKLESIKKHLSDVELQLENVKQVNETLKEKTENAEKDRTKAVVELEVLTKYYKEKELEYGKEIGVQRVKREQREEDASSLASQLELYVEEIDILKKQLKSTKKELEETERRFKSQLNQLEKRAHENWIAARNAERKYEESNAEATALRQTLTMSLKSPPPADLSISGFLDDTASSISSLPDLNNSIQLPPPPPPPPLMIPLNSMIPPPQMNIMGGGVSAPQMYNSNVSLNDSSNFYWQSGANSNQYPSLDSNQSAIPNDQSNIYGVQATGSQAIQPSSSSQAQYGQASIQMTNITTSMNSSPAYPPQQHQQQYSTPQQNSSYGHQWNVDNSRNTYSPALSHRSSTATPLTNIQNSPNTNSMLAQSSGYNIQGTPQQVSVQSTGGQSQQYSNSSSSSNPFSISNQYPSNHYQNHQNDSNVAYGSGAPGATLTATQTHQMWTGVVGQQQQQQSNNDLNPYSVHPSQQQQYSNNSLPSETGSRPASVHTQMV